MLPKPVVAGLSARQIVILAAFGAVLWLAAALLLRALAPLGIYDGTARVILYAAIVPGTWPFVILLARIAGLVPSQVLAGVAIALAAATLLDGIAIAWFPALYGSTVDHLAGAGAAILWGAGVILVLGRSCPGSVGPTEAIPRRGRFGRFAGPAREAGRRRTYGILFHFRRAALCFHRLA